MNQAYLYFRTQGTIGDDDDKAQSCLFPMSSFAGYEATSASGTNSVVLYFKSMQNYDGMDQADDSVTISDSVVINLKDTATQKEFISAFTQKVNEIRIDDDQDSIWLTVDIGDGASCHVGYRSCFYRSIPMGPIDNRRKVEMEFLEKEKKFDPEEVYKGQPNPTKI